ncbi:WD repeat-containing and planar cell polarity effector protein fritz [Phlebotomus argentipes]|uniref:WD repeat-containing and planar cell polarity effector protein fritz n=1 Tax=Phlebotomus argentipes TaxID=94469 RepID=UPI0028931FCA|nr:WD repeat-containing and planar cell polarity effector protein fritz [Phlebotomus argentipes]
MLTLLSETRLWSCREDIKIKETDFGCYRYHQKKELADEGLYAAGKRLYGQRRDIRHAVDKGAPKLRSGIRKLEELLEKHKVIYCQWKDNVVLRLMLSNGLIVHVCVNIFTGEVMRVAFDKYFLGKIISEAITDVLMTRLHILIAYNQNQITFVYLQKPSLRRSVPEKISRMEPKIFNIIIGGPQGRKLPRQISCNVSGDLVAIWTRSSQNEVYPWRPTVRDQDRANIHIYKFSRAKLEPLCFHWTENDPICIEFVRLSDNQLRTVEQRVSRKGEVTIESSIYEINKVKLNRIAVTSIPLQTQVCCHSYSPDHEKLMLGCIDGSIVLFDEGRGITHLVKAAFIATMISWHGDSGLVVIANERCQFQCFDISLSCIKSQLISEDYTPSNILDVSNYFSSQPTLSRICWSRKPDLQGHAEKFSQTDSFLLLIFEGGPVGCMRFFGGAGMKGDIHTSGFTPDVFVHSYLSVNQVEKAINILLCLNWDTYGAMCLCSLHKIANFIFRHPLTADRELQLQKALGSFHVPVKPLCEETELEFGDQVKDITRKFFQYLLRYRSFEKAFSLGIDINDEDLFMDLHNAAVANGDGSLAEDALKKAEEIINNANSRGSSHSTCSHSSCSLCTDNSASSSEDLTTEGVQKPPDVVECSSCATESDNLLGPSVPNKRQGINAASVTSTASSASSYLEHPPLPTVSTSKTSYIPPLPYTANTLPDKSFRITIPKPELKISRASTAFGGHNVKTLYNSHEDIFLTDPPLPMAKGGGGKKSHVGGSQQNLLDDRMGGWRPNLGHNSFSTDYIDRFHDAFNFGNHQGKGGNAKPPIALPRSVFPNEHMVIDVIPKPSTAQMPRSTSAIDQTLGIPLTYNPPSFHHVKHSFPSVSLYGRSTVSVPRADSLQSINTVAVPTVIHQYPLISGNIPAVSSNSSSKAHQLENSAIINPSTSGNSSYLRNTKDTASILALTSPSGRTQANLVASGAGQSAKKESGEKNKVKFSDTITVAVVPEIPRKEKPSVPSDRSKRANGWSQITDPQKELADSLPLCHPNDEYLKDFTPMSDVNPDADNEVNPRNSSSTIKVVHFGVV